MSAAAMLREALALGRGHSPELLFGDERDPCASEAQGGPPTPAAVLVPVVDRPEPTVILTLRPDTLRQHAGQIAFPGGRIDPGDDGPVAAALREAHEEIALPPGEVEVIGLADSYRTVTGYEVTPVIGVIPPDLPLRPQHGEVAALFEVPLDYLLSPENQKVRTILWHGEERSYYEIVWDDRRIWGATAAMIVNLSRRLTLVS